MSAASCRLSAEEMRRQCAELAQQAQQAEAKLAGLRGGGARLVSKADVALVEKVRGLGVGGVGSGG